MAAFDVRLAAMADAPFRFRKKPFSVTKSHQRHKQAQITQTNKIYRYVFLQRGPPSLIAWVTPLEDPRIPLSIPNEYGLERESIYLHRI